MPGRPPTLVESARREAIVCGVVFVVAITWTITYCLRNGYQGEHAELEFVLGFPKWIFYGILVPWGCCTLVAAIFSFFFMTDHELGDPTAEDVTPQEEATELSLNKETPHE